MKNNVDQIRAYQANFARNVKKVTTLSGVVLATASFLLLVQPQAAQAETTPATTVSQSTSAASQASAPATPASSTSTASASSVVAPASASASTSAANSANSSANASVTNTTSSTNSSEPALYKAAEANTPTVATNPDVVANAVNTTSAPNIKTYTPSNNAGSVTNKGSYSTSADAIDVSSYQGVMSVNTYTNLKNQGVKYVIVKLTQGTTYVNPYAGTQIANAKAAGLTVYAYDYVTFTSTGAAQAEAAYFAAAARRFGLGTDTLMIADVEDDVVKRGDITSLLNAYWAALSTQGFTNHAVYTGYYFDQQYKVSSTVGKSRTWIAAYYYSYWKNTILNSGYGAWQYTDSFNGIDGSIDMGLFSSNVAKNGESYENGHWYLYQGGVKQTGFMRLTDGRVVYYNGAGQMQYGLQTINGATYYFRTDNGNMVTGQTTVNGSSYYFDPKTGQRQTGLVYNQAGKTFQYYDLTTGKLLTSANGTYVGKLHVQANGTVDLKTLTNGLNVINGVRYYYNATTQTLVSGLMTVSGKTYYFDPTTKKAVSGQLNLNGYWYGFSSDGIMQTGFTKLSDGRIVYYNTQGHMMYGWQTIANKTYYFDQASGAMYTGEHNLSGYWYYFGTNGQMTTGFAILPDQRTVYYNAKGQMQYGEQNVGGKWYYFNTTDGRMVSGWYTLPDGRKVYYDTHAGGSGNGMLHGMQKVGNATYYFNLGYGTLESGLKTINGKRYYFAPTMLTSAERYVDGHWSYFGADGAMVTGFTQLKDGRTVYYNSQGQMMYGEQNINGKWYYFNHVDGRMAMGWYTLPDGRKVYYDVKAGGAGNGMLHGIQSVNGQTYYFDQGYGTLRTSTLSYNPQLQNLVYFGSDGAMVKNTTIKLGGKTYMVGINGALKLSNGENLVNGGWYLYNSQTGKLQTGWQIVSGNRTVYYDPNTGVMDHGEAKIGNYWYFFDLVNGQMRTGWVTLPDGRRVYYDKQGHMVYGTQTIDGKTYTFDRVIGALKN